MCHLQGWIWSSLSRTSEDYFNRSAHSAGPGIEKKMGHVFCPCVCVACVSFLRCFALPRCPKTQGRRGQQSTRRETRSIEKQLSKRGENSSKSEAWGLHFGTNLGAKFAPGGLRDPLGRQVGSRSLPGRLPKRSGAPPGPRKNSLLSSGGGAP